MAVDHADRGLQYRVVGELVQRSTDGGRRWTTILTPAGSGRSGGCFLVRYRHVNALVVSGLLPGTLFVATAGQPARVPRTRHAEPALRGRQTAFSHDTMRPETGGAAVPRTVLPARGTPAGAKEKRISS